MSQLPQAGHDHGLELHLFTPTESLRHVELLTAIAHYHVTGSPLGLGHSVHFGRPWYPDSRCGYGLISPPYLDGPDLEWMSSPDAVVRCLWLIPITERERDFKTRSGIEALEQRFESTGFNYLNPHRPSAV